MRKLNDNERLYLTSIINPTIQTIKKIMTFFKIFGLLQILLIIFCIIFANESNEIKFFMLIGCVILYLVYFKLPQFLATHNQYTRLLTALENACVYECELINMYYTSSSSRTIVEMSLNGEIIRCNGDPILRDKSVGTKLCLICCDDIRFKYAIELKEY